MQTRAKQTKPEREWVSLSSVGKFVTPSNTAIPAENQQREDNEETKKKSTEKASISQDALAQDRKIADQQRRAQKKFFKESRRVIYDCTKEVRALKVLCEQCGLEVPYGKFVPHLVKCKGSALPLTSPKLAPASPEKRITRSHSKQEPEECLKAVPQPKLVPRELQEGSKDQPLLTMRGGHFLISPRGTKGDNTEGLLSVQAKAAIVVSSRPSSAETLTSSTSKSSNIVVPQAPITNLTLPKESGTRTSPKKGGTDPSSRATKRSASREQSPPRDGPTAAIRRRFSSSTGLSQNTGVPQAPPAKSSPAPQQLPLVPSGTRTRFRTRIPSPPPQGQKRGADPSQARLLDGPTAAVRRRLSSTGQVLVDY